MAIKKKEQQTCLGNFENFKYDFLKLSKDPKKTTEIHQLPQENRMHEMYSYMFAWGFCRHQEAFVEALTLQLKTGEDHPHFGRLYLLWEMSKRPLSTSHVRGGRQIKMHRSIKPDSMGWVKT